MFSRLMGAIQGLSVSALLPVKAAILPLPTGLKAVSSCLGRLAPTLGLEASGFMREGLAGASSGLPPADMHALTVACDVM